MMAVVLQLFQVTVVTVLRAVFVFSMAWLRLTHHMHSYA